MVVPRRDRSAIVRHLLQAASAYLARRNEIGQLVGGHKIASYRERRGEESLDRRTEALVVQCGSDAAGTDTGPGDKSGEKSYKYKEEKEGAVGW